jgi:hypothetical protein
MAAHCLFQFNRKVRILRIAGACIAIGSSDWLGPKLNGCETDDIESFDDEIEGKFNENEGYYVHETIFNFGNKSGNYEETQKMDEDFQVFFIF